MFDSKFEIPSAEHWLVLSLWHFPSIHFSKYWVVVSDCLLQPTIRAGNPIFGN